jgi:hypothetical protein
MREGRQTSVPGHGAGYCQRRAPLWLSKAYKTPLDAPIERVSPDSTGGL